MGCLPMLVRARPGSVQNPTQLEGHQIFYVFWTFGLSKLPTTGKHVGEQVV
jgi:hypothetical protein